MNKKLENSLFTYKSSSEFIMKDLMPLIGNVELTNRCNLKCTICANSNMKRLREDMSPQTLLMIMSRLHDAGVLQVILNTVGETLIYPHIDLALETAKSYGFYVLVSTNGQELNENKAHSLVNGSCDLVRISVNSVNPKQYEAIHRGGNFERLIKNINYFVNLRNRNNSKTVIRIRAVLPRHLAEAERLKQEIDAFWVDRVDEVEYVIFGNMGGRNGAKPIKDWRRVPCRTIWRGVNILLDGQVSFCPCDFDADCVVGSLWSKSLEKIWIESSFKRIRKAHIAGDFNDLERCGRCDATRLEWYERKEVAVTSQEAAIMNRYFQS